MNNDAENSRETRKNLLASIMQKVSEKKEILTDFLHVLLEKGKEKISTRTLLSSESLTFQYLKEKREEKESQILVREPFFSSFFIDYKDGRTKQIYLGKYRSEIADIVSWTSPIGSMRFKTPGNHLLVKPDGGTLDLFLDKKYTIDYIHGDIGSITYQEKETERLLLFKKEIDISKTEFKASDIIGEMEEYQDLIMRISPSKKILIDGLAGSGKTTVALHRLCFVMLYPLYEKETRATNSLVIVKDEDSKNYFKNILLELEVETIQIKTFIDFVSDIIDITGFTIVEEYSSETSKIKKEITHHVPFSSDYKSYLLSFYGKNQKIHPGIEMQLQKKILDYLDLAHLIHGIKRTRGFLSRKNSRAIPLSYFNILIDEYQNYSECELDIFDYAVLPSMRGIIYTGDVYQTVFEKGKKTEKFTESIQETIFIERNYRIPEKIRDYLVNENFIPHSIISKRSGGSLDFISIKNLEEIKNLVEKAEKNIIHAILVPDEMQKENLKKYIAKLPENFHFYTFRESQGFEFDSVFLLLPADYKNLELLEKNLLYIAMTRAVNSLHLIELE